MNISYWRKQRGLSQKELATRTGVHINTVNRWEGGHREPRAADLAKLCEVLGVSETELIRGPAQSGGLLKMRPEGNTVTFEFTLPLNIIKGEGNDIKGEGNDGQSENSGTVTGAPAD